MAVRRSVSRSRAQADKPAVPSASPTEPAKISKETAEHEQPKRRGLKRFAYLPAVFFVLYYVIDFWLAHKNYLTSTAEIAAIANEARARGQAGNATDIMDHAVTLLTEKYGNAIQADAPWIFMRAGGWMGAFKMLYATPSEYVLLFGTGIHTSGHSGRYWADISDTLLTGRFLQWEEGAVEPIMHQPGATILHPRWSVTGVQWESGTWMLEHATGFIPSTLPFALSDGVISCQDLSTVRTSIGVYANQVVNNMMRGRV